MSTPPQTDSGSAEAKALASAVSDKLDMVVWLRGDEPFFNEFSLNADQVMKHLNIKRSRLTQISGKELRVGRTRIDRYIRPVYRPEDIEEYLQWTRPTASHQKSSKVLEEAAQKLSKEYDSLLSEIDLKMQALAKNLEPSKHEISQNDFTCLYQDLRREIKKLGSNIEHKLNLDFTTKHLQLLRTQLEDLTTIVDNVDHQLTTLPALKDLFAQVLSTVQFLQTGITSLQAKQIESTQTLIKAIDHLEHVLIAAQAPQPNFTNHPYSYAGSSVGLAKQANLRQLQNNKKNEHLDRSQLNQSPRYRKKLPL